MKLLIVDDSKADRLMVTYYLKSLAEGGAPFEVLEADSIASAIEVVEKESADLVLLDYGLTDGTAEDFLRKLPELNLKQAVHVAVVTGHDDPGKSRALMELGAIDYYTKEMITATTLPVVIRGLIEKLQMRRKLVEQQEMLEEQKQELEAFASRVSHDLKAAFQNLSNASECIGNAENLDDVHESAALINMGLTQAERIVDGLYGLSSLKHARNEEFKDASLAQLIASAVACNPKQYASAAYDLDCPHHIKCSGKVFPQVFQNLLDNSFKFSDKEELKIAIYSSQQDGGIRIVYEDNGPGFPDEIKPTLFEAFKAQHKENQEGLGLGMNIVKKIIEVHNGSIKIIKPKRLSGVALEIVVPD